MALRVSHGLVGGGVIARGGGLISRLHTKEGPPPRLRPPPPPASPSQREEKEKEEEFCDEFSLKRTPSFHPTSFRPTPSIFNYAY